MNKKLIILITMLCLLFSSISMAQEISKADILQKLDEISAIENDISRLEAYDKLVSSLNISSTDSNSSTSGKVITQYKW